MNNSLTGFDYVLDVFQNPEKFESLPKREEHYRLLCLWRIPSFEALSSWSLYETKSQNDFILRRLEYDYHKHTLINNENPDIIGSEAIIDSVQLKNILKAFVELKIPIFHQNDRVTILDGTSYGIEFGNWWQKTIVHWQESVNKEWYPLMELFNNTIKLMDHYLPKSTLRDFKL